MYNPFLSKRMEFSQVAKGWLPMEMSQHPSCHSAAPEPWEATEFLGMKFHLGTLPTLCSYEDSMPPLHMVVAITYFTCIEDLEDSFEIPFHFFPQMVLSAPQGHYVTWRTWQRSLKWFTREWEPRFSSLDQCSSYTPAGQQTTPGKVRRLWDDGKIWSPV